MYIFRRKYCARKGDGPVPDSGDKSNGKITIIGDETTVSTGGAGRFFSEMCAIIAGRFFQRQLFTSVDYLEKKGRW
jgi:hypothetical protein